MVEVAKDLLPLLTKLVITLLDSILCNMNFEFSQGKAIFVSQENTNKQSYNGLLLDVLEMNKIKLSSYYYLGTHWPTSG